MKTLLILIGLVASMYAVEISLTPEQNITATEKEVTMVVDIYNEYNQTVDPVKIKNHITENRALVKAYMQEHKPLSYKYSKTIQHKIEQMMADDMIKEMQLKTELPLENILYSYYLDNQKRYETGKMVTFDELTFNSYEDANKAYEALNADINNSAAYIKAQKYHVTAYNKIPVSETYFTIYRAVKNHMVPAALPPQMLNQYTVFVIHEEHESEAKTYESVKAQVKEDILKESFVKARENLIKKYVEKP